MKIEQLSNDNFKSTIESNDKIVLVDFYADWCTPCKMISPLVEEIADENDNVAVYKVNVDENPTIAAEFAIMSIPTLISFKDNSVYKQMVGVKSKEDILDLVK